MGISDSAFVLIHGRHWGLQASAARGTVNIIQVGQLSSTKTCSRTSHTATPYFNVRSAVRAVKSAFRAKFARQQVMVVPQQLQQKGQHFTESQLALDWVR
jgi:hypothetical protein